MYHPCSVHSRTFTLHHSNPIYKVMDVPCFREREFETGQLMINKRVHWKPVNLAWFLNKQHPFYYKMLFGDKDTFRFAWKALGAPYHLVQYMAAEVGFMTEAPAQICGHTLGHHDPQGNIVFLHAHLIKWHEWKGDYRYSHFRYWTVCFVGHIVHVLLCTPLLLLLLLSLPSLF